MGFKLKSQKAVKQGGFKFMGSSPMKEDDIEAKIDEVDNQELYEKGATRYKGQGIGTENDLAALQFLPGIDVERPKASPIADAINKATEVKSKKLNIDFKPKSKKSSTSSSGDVTVKTRFIDGVKDVEKRTYTTKDGVKVKEKKKFSPSGEVVKNKKRAKKGDTIVKTKTKGDNTKRTVTKSTKSKINEVKGKAKEKIDKLKSKLKK
tara:strand:- start:4884 stop:5504 length:621 start_codon:yes stop_codon:yes gene_type:complete